LVTEFDARQRPVEVETVNADAVIKPKEGE